MKPGLRPGCVIALLGAESTGKSTLAQALTQRLRNAGLPATCVPEYLREWCAHQGRTPRPHEQAAIAGEQTRRIAAAAAHAVAVADTTALMTAVYSDLLFDDLSLYADALTAQRAYALTLLTALDLPWVADGLQRDGPHVRAPVDARVRTALSEAGLAFTVIHGQGAQRLEQAWNAVLATTSHERAAQAHGASPAAPPPLRCERCSDADCEHRLFTRLLAAPDSASG